MRVKFSIPNLPQSADIGQNLDGDISDFRISCRSLIKEICHSSKTSHDIDMKVGSVTKLDKRNKTASKRIDDNVMSANWSNPEDGFRPHSL